MFPECIKRLSRVVFLCAFIFLNVGHLKVNNIKSKGVHEVDSPDE